MNGLHDLGGMHGFGPILAEPEGHEPLFHHPWEADVLTSMFATLRLGQWSLDEFRSTIEHQPPLQYLRRTYYEKWLVALEILAVEHGLLADAELAERCAVLAAAPRSSSSGPSTKPPAAAGVRLAAEEVAENDALCRAGRAEAADVEVALLRCE